MASPAELILHYHCLDIGCIGFSEDAGIGGLPTGCEASFCGNVDGMSPGSSGDIGK